MAKKGKKKKQQNQKFMEEYAAPLDTVKQGTTSAKVPRVDEACAEVFGAFVSPRHAVEGTSSNS